jgi:threonine aldolase
MICMKIIDLRSDTVTAPTDEMREAMYKAPVGDDVYGDDPTVRELEEYAAELTGKEASLFVPSGTFGNQLALLTHCKRGDEVILGDDCHIVAHEVGAASVIAGVQLRTLNSRKGELDPAEVESRIRSVEDIHYPGTGLICIENAHSNGRTLSFENMSAIRNTADKYEIPVHMDGARLFNAAAHYGVHAKEVTKYSDSVMFCLSKGLCSPVGSMLAGNRKFIDRARKNRKLMGGGLRQAGILAAAGLISLRSMTKRLGADHENACTLARELSLIPGITLSLEDVHINLVFFNISGTGKDGDWLVDALVQRGIKSNPAENGWMRFATHYWVTAGDIRYISDTMKELLSR